MSILGDLYRRAVIGSWQTPESTRNFGGDTIRRTFRIRLGRGMNGRKHPGRPVPVRTGNRLQGAQPYSRRLPGLYRVPYPRVPVRVDYRRQEADEKLDECFMRINGALLRG